MIVFLNGRFVPENEAMVSVFDRSFLYGDGVFDTVYICNQKPFRWRQHLDRFCRGAMLLEIKLPYSTDEIGQFARELIRLNEMSTGVLRLTLSRGVGFRGYSPAGSTRPTLVMSAHPIVEENQGQLHTWNLIISSWRIAADDQLGAAKTSNKLRQVLARAEAEAHQAHEALLLNTAGEVAEGSSANLFWIESGVVCTPPLSSGALPGVTRGVVMELCQQRKICCQEQSCPLERLRDAAGIFLTFSSLGIVEAVSLNGKPLARSPLTRQLHTAYHQLLARESDTA